MKITVFTGNQPRHLALLSALASFGEEIYAIQECSTVRPGQVADSIGKSDVMRDYFQHVIAAERAVFGAGTFCPPAVRQLAIRMGDLNLLSLSDLGPALEADVFVVFGSSYIKGKLAEFLVQHRAYNIHMGTSPYYRGSATNFWALYDGRPAVRRCDDSSAQRRPGQRSHTFSCPAAGTGHRTLSTRHDFSACGAQGTDSGAGQWFAANHGSSAAGPLAAVAVFAEFRLYR